MAVVLTTFINLHSDSVNLLKQLHFVSDTQTTDIVQRRKKTKNVNQASCC